MKQLTVTKLKIDIDEEIAFIEAEKKAIREGILLYGNEEDIYGVM